MTNPYTAKIAIARAELARIRAEAEERERQGLALMAEINEAIAPLRLQREEHGRISLTHPLLPDSARWVCEADELLQALPVYLESPRFAREAEYLDEQAREAVRKQNRVIAVAAAQLRRGPTPLDAAVVSALSSLVMAAIMGDLSLFRVFVFVPVVALVSYLLVRFLGRLRS